MLNPEIEMQQVSTEGYTRSDLHMYYGGTLLLALLPSGGYKVVHVGEVVENSDGEIVFYCDKLGQRFDGLDFSEGLSPDILFRFLVPQGFYMVGGTPVTYEYLQSRDYKKGLVPSRIRTTDRWQRAIKAAVNVNDSGMRVLSRRVVVNEGKILTMYRNLTLGSSPSDGVLETPYECLRQRIEEV